LNAPEADKFAALEKLFTTRFARGHREVLFLSLPGDTGNDKPT